MAAGAAAITALGAAVGVDVACATRPVALAVRSEPAGITLRVEGRPVRTPWRTVVTSGTSTVLQAPLTVRTQRGRLRFAGWSDGAPARHVLVVPPTDARVTATYRRDRRPPASAPATDVSDAVDLPDTVPVLAPAPVAPGAPPAARWLLGDTRMLALRSPIGA